MKTLFVFEVGSFASRTLRNYVLRTHCSLQHFDLLLQSLELASLDVVRGSPLLAAQGTELKVTLLTPHWSSLLQH